MNMLTDFNRPGECLEIHYQQHVRICIFSPRALNSGHFAVCVKIYSHWNYSSLALSHKYEIKQSLVGKFMCNTILYKALPIGHCICLKQGFGLHTLESHTLHIVKRLSPPTPVTQHNINSTSVSCWKRKIFYIECTQSVFTR